MVPLRIWLIFTAAPRDSYRNRVQRALSGGREWNLGLFYPMRGPGKDRREVTGEGKRWDKLREGLQGAPPRSHPSKGMGA